MAPSNRETTFLRRKTSWDPHKPDRHLDIILVLLFILVWVFLLTYLGGIPLF